MAAAHDDDILSGFHPVEDFAEPRLGLCQVDLKHCKQSLVMKLVTSYLGFAADATVCVERDTEIEDRRICPFLKRRVWARSRAMNQTPTKPARPLDHLVLPVVDLETARSRYEAMGFTVAPRGEHPFGTENACVFFPGGTFLEPLAVASRETCEAEARAGNAFVARDQAYRFRRGQDGFSAVVMGTADADADDAAFRAAGLSAGAMLTFSRAFRTPAGEEGEAAFKLAFAADLRAPDAFFFTCERVGVPAVDRATLERHANGVTGIREIVAVEDNPSDFQYLVQEIAGTRDVGAHSFGISVKAGDAALSVTTPAGLEAFFGAKADGRERGLRLMAVVFSVVDLAALKAHLARNGIAHRTTGHRLVVDRVPGQGAIFAFEE